MKIDLTRTPGGLRRSKTQILIKSRRPNRLQASEGNAQDGAQTEFEIQ